MEENFPIIIIESLEDYLKELTSFSDTLFYRGLCNLKYDLIPSVGRYGIKEKEHLDYFEFVLLEDFKRKAPMYLKTIPTNDLDWLILAQHHGLPTRLLDWSFNPLVALFFAVEKDVDTDCCVYSSYSSNKLPIVNHNRIFSHQECQAIVPSFTNVRYTNQESVFTFHSEPSNPNYTYIHKKFIIKNEHKKQIRWKLRRIGITKSFIYQNLDSLAYDILETQKIKFENVPKIKKISR